VSLPRPRPPISGRAIHEDALAPGAPVDLTVDLAPEHGGLLLANPILAAAGTFGYGVEHGEMVDVERIGAICTRGTTRQARSGNPPPRMALLAGGVVNAVGLQNPGVDVVIDRYAPIWASWQVPVVVNVCGSSVADYVDVVHRMEGVSGIRGIELNLSCPNGHGGPLFGLDAGLAETLTAAIRRVTDLPLVVKLSPEAPDIRPIARAIRDAGADALSAVNTLPAVIVSEGRERPGLGVADGYGGLSGPALKPTALRVVYEVAQAVDLPIVAIGGVTSLDDVLDYLAVGASAVAVGTALFGDPGLAVRLVDELADACRRRGLDTYRPLVGTALPRRQRPPSIRGVEYRP
jgi:dihydroorotate dehydrogenase (NAD+) catalytic subunit